MASKIEKWAAKSDDELRKEIHDIRRAWFGLRTEIANQASDNTAGLGKLRRELARIKTVLRQRQLAPGQDS